MPCSRALTARRRSGALFATPGGGGEGTRATHQDGSEDGDRIVRARGQLGQRVVHDEADLVQAARGLQNGHGLPHVRLQREKEKRKTKHTT